MQYKDYTDLSSNGKGYLHEYDKGTRKAELSTLKEVRQLLKGTDVPAYVGQIIDEQIKDVELILLAGVDERLS